MRQSSVLYSLFLGGCVLMSSGGASAGQLPAELALCAAIADATARLGCYDGLALRVEDLPTAVVGARDQGSANAEARTQGRPSESGAGDVAGTDATVTPRWLGMRPYRRNYILPVTYNSRQQAAAGDGESDGFELDDVEIKFQLSFELPIWADLFDSDVDLYFAYTQLSFFQAYNSEYSAPFRDTSYEPELGLNWHPDLRLGDWQFRSVRVALNHQSNGRSRPNSRSWNRIVGQAQASRGNLDLGARIWQRFDEDPENDDNPDITRYLGYGELFAGYRTGRHHFGLMLRNPAKHAAMQADWSYGLSDRLRFYVQYFNGYGESLIDYDRQVNRIGAGFLLNEWP